jgi:hypothetical protein
MGSDLRHSQPNGRGERAKSPKRGTMKRQRRGQFSKSFPACLHERMARQIESVRDLWRLKSVNLLKIPTCNNPIGLFDTAPHFAPHFFRCV